MLVKAQAPVLVDGAFAAENVQALQVLLRWHIGEKTRVSISYRSISFLHHSVFAGVDCAISSKRWNLTSPIQNLPSGTLTLHPVSPILSKGRLRCRSKRWAKKSIQAAATPRRPGAWWHFLGAKTARG